ncbi:hypothetical protein [Tardiphaga sp. 862_B3_N1_1]|uniref:hypothetical protein n=1 Tax=Tardiphaga sp. 862_B3_N1_1 TaxID=3240763 RepID=UPI003F8AEC98
MKLIIYYLRAASSPTAQADFTPISGDFTDVNEARHIAIATATKNPRFSSWCVGFEIEDARGKVVSKWSVEDVPSP